MRHSNLLLLQFLDYSIRSWVLLAFFQLEISRSSQLPVPPRIYYMNMLYNVSQ